MTITRNPARADLARRVRQIYEEHPYPCVQAQPAGAHRWQLPSLNWLNDLWQPTAAFPARVLVAGCGTGNEAVTLQHCFPQAQIVGVDFCAGSIALARRRQRAGAGKGIRFAVADLASADLGKIARGPFDFISCHGVLSYLPRPRVALQNLARLLQPEGALYLGVNGAGHFSIRWRRALAHFGYDLAKMPSDRNLPKVIALFDSLSDDMIAEPARREPSFLPTDLFGPFIRTASLREWVHDAARAGLHFLGAEEGETPFRKTVANESYDVLWPRSRAEVAQLGDDLRPTQFHRILLTKREVPAIPWNRPQELAGWRPTMAPHLRAHRWPGRRGPWKTLRRLIIRSPLFNLQTELRTPEWIVEVIRQSRGEISLGAILAGSRGSMKSQTLRKHLYLLHQLYLLNFLPPLAESSRHFAPSRPHRSLTTCPRPCSRRSTRLPSTASMPTR